MPFPEIPGFDLFEDNLSKSLATVRKELGLNDLVAINGYAG